MDLKIKLVFLNLYKIIYMRKLSLLLPIFFLLVSCQNTSVDDIDLAEDIPQNITSLSQMTSSLLDVYFLSINIYDGQNNKREDEDKDEDKDGKEICFEFVLPVSFNMPDGSVITIDSKEDWKVLYNWYKENKDSDDKPEIILPFNVIIDDEEITISNEEEFQRLLDFIDNECKEESDEKNEECFEFVLPVSFDMPDGSVLTIETEDDWKKLERWYRENENTSEVPEIIFPVQVIYKDETLTINNVEELQELLEDCKED